MSQLKLTADSGGGTVAIKGPASTTGDAAIDLTVPGTASTTLDTLGRAGNILQVKQAVKTDTFSLNGSATSDVTGLSVAITPLSTSNKILVFYNLSVAIEYNGYSGFIFLLRDSTQIYLGDAAGSRQGASSFMTSHSASDYGAYEMFDVSGTFLDSPSTTSATTYKIQMKSLNNGRNFYLNRHQNDGDAIGSPRTASSITVMEVAA